MTKARNHYRIEYKSESLILAYRLKRAAAVSTDNLRDIFNDECRSSSVGSSISFKQLESTLCKRRRLDLPKPPSSSEDFSQILLNSPFSKNHRLPIREGNGSAVVFATDLLLSKLIEVETIHFDATFKEIPHPLY